MTPEREARLTDCLRRAAKPMAYLSGERVSDRLRADAEKAFRAAFIEAVEIVLEDRQERRAAGKPEKGAT